jgi:uncharacterized damage-inducible protein DinB
VWLRGPVPDVEAPLQPIAHAILQALEDVERLTSAMEIADLWTSLGGAATVGFHLRHMTGSLDRLLTYARGESLSEKQRAALAQEKEPTPEVSAEVLLQQFRKTVGAAIEQLRRTERADLDEPRPVGRAGYPSSVRGLLHHAGEHTVRHAGQIMTTARILQGLRSNGAA